MRKRTRQWAWLAVVLFVGATLAGCNKQGPPKTEKVGKETAQKAKPEAAKPESPASKYTIQDVCDKEVAEKKIAYKNSPMSDQGYKDMGTNCMDSEKEPFKDLADAARAEGVYADAVMAACGDKGSSEWAVCWADMKEGAVKKALGK